VLELDPGDGKAAESRVQAHSCAVVDLLEAARSVCLLEATDAVEHMLGCCKQEAGDDLALTQLPG
jgi:hypothetical protein